MVRMADEFSGGVPSSVAVITSSYFCLNSKSRLPLKVRFPVMASKVKLLLGSPEEMLNDILELLPESLSLACKMDTWVSREVRIDDDQNSNGNCSNCHGTFGIRREDSWRFAKEG